MGLNDFSIKIMGKEISLDMIPEEGLNLANLSDAAKNALSIFDTDSKKGVLSKQEFKNAILFFQKQDKEYQENKKWLGDEVIILHKKDNDLDVNETSDTQSLIESQNGGKRVSLGRLSDDIEIAILKQKAKSTNHLKDTVNIDWAVDNKGQYYKWNSSNNIYDLMPDVSKVNKDGSYETKVTNNKSQTVKTNFDKDGEARTLSVLNYENKRYVNPDYAAKVAGLKKEKEITWGPSASIIQFIINTYINDGEPTGLYIDVNNLTAYNWDDKKHMFVAVGKLEVKPEDDKSIDDGNIYKHVYDGSSYQRYEY